MAKLLTTGQIKKYQARLLKAQDNNAKDPQTGHRQADTVLTDILEAIGYGGLAGLYRGVEKLYD